MKYIYTVIAAVTLLGAFSCSPDEFLKEEPKGLFSSDAIKTEADALAAVNGIYYALGEKNAFNDYEGIRDIAFGTTETKNGFKLYKWNFNSGTASFSLIWAQLYRGINNANWVIDVVDNMPETAGFTKYIGGDGQEYTTQDRIVAEAKFLRAITYFYLVNIWGNVPMITTPFVDATQDFYVPESDTGKIYQDLIIKDLINCSNVLPIQSNYGVNDFYRATSGAAKAMLAKTFLYLGDYNKFSPVNANIAAANSCYEKAMQYAQEVIESGDYKLVDNYMKCLSTQFENNSERIFAFPHDVGTLYDQMGARTMPPNNPLGVNAPSWRGNRLILENIVRRMPFDFRRWATVYYAIGSKRGFYTNKYWDVTVVPSASLGSNDFYVIRLAEVYLIYADASNELNEGATPKASEYLCEVRKRAAKFFGDVSSTQSPSHLVNYFNYGSSFVPTGTLEFMETASKPNNSMKSIAIDYSTVDLSVGVPSAINGNTSNRPTPDYTNLYYNDPAMLENMDYAQFSNEIWLDYENELFWEGTRVFDYFRKRKLEELWKVNNRVDEGLLYEKHYLFPKPMTEVMANPKIQQNPGW